MIFAITTTNEKEYNSLFENIDKCEGIGKIVSFKEETQYKNKYIVEIKEINSIEKNNKKLIFYTEKNINLEYGDIVYFKGEITNTPGQRNKYGFNYRRYLRQNKIYGVLNISETQIIEKNSDIITKIQKARYKIKENLFKQYSKEEAGFLSGLLIGDKSDVSETIIEDFKNSNLSHILAISGMHVSYVLVGVEFTLKKVIKNKKLRNYILIFFLVFFILFTGGSASCIRACIMSSLIIFSKNIYRKSDFLTNLMLALDNILIINPYNIENIGMWLSFGGTIGLSKAQFLGFKSKFKESLKTSFSVFIIIFPIILYFYNTISLTFFISNFLISFIIGPILILGYISLIVTPIVFIEKILIKILFNIASIVGALPLSKIYIATPNLVYFITYYIIIIGIFICKNKNISLKKFLKCICIFICIFTLFIYIKTLIFRNFELHFLDVGQGDCSLIITEKNKKILIDGGDKTEKYDYGEKVVLPYLMKKGIQYLDYIVISHFDSDHVRRSTNNYR